MASLISKQVTALVEPILNEIGFELVGVEYLSSQGRWVLRVYMDKNGGVTIDDCVAVSRELSDLMDIKDIIEHEYVLEISSPGLNRPLVKKEDFIRFLGKKIKIKMLEPVYGRRNFAGLLKDFQDSTIYLESDGDLISLPWTEIDRANIVYEFDN